MLGRMDKKNGKEPDYEENLNEDSDIIDILDEDYGLLLKESKRDLLLQNHRAKVTTLSFHSWYTQKYKRNFKQSDKDIFEAYMAGSGDEIENNEYIMEDNELKMNHYKMRSSKLADQVQILYSLLDNVTKKADMPEALKKLVKKILSEQP